MEEHTVLYTLATFCAFAAGVCANRIYRLWQDRKAVAAVGEAQHNPASPKLVDDFLAMAEKEGRKDFVLSELAAIRRTYGHAGLRNGHLSFVHLKLLGKVPENEPAPSFEPRT